MNALVAFGAALLALRLAGLLARRWRATRRPELAAWAWALAAYAVAAAAIAWGEAAQWDGRAFRVYYASGALLTAPLLGVGSLRSRASAARPRSASPTQVSRPGSRSRCRCTASSPGMASRRPRITWRSSRPDSRDRRRIRRNARGRRGRAALAAPPPARKHPDRAGRRGGSDRERRRRARGRRRGHRNRGAAPSFSMPVSPREPLPADALRQSSQTLHLPPASNLPRRTA